MHDQHAAAEAVVVILAAIAEADGLVADAEAAWWIRLRKRHALFAGIPHQALEDIFTRAAERIRAHPVDAVIRDAAGAIPPDQAQTVLDLAADLARTDGRADAAESRVLGVLAGALGLPRP